MLRRGEQNPKRSQDAPRIDAMDSHAEPIPRLFAAHFIDAVGDHLDSIDASHRREHAEEQRHGERQVLVDLKLSDLALPDICDTDAGLAKALGNA